MNNKIKKYLEVTLLCLCVGFVAGSNNLKIFRNVDDTVVQVPSKIEVPSGANLTLICQIENIINKGIINGYVTWFIPPEIHSEVKLSTLKNSSNLVFRNMNTNDEGLYVCTSLKYKIFKTLRLLLKQSESAKRSYLNIPRLIKREIVPGNGHYNYNYTDNFEYNRKFTELKKETSILTEDLLKEIKREQAKKRKSYDDYNYDISFNNHREDSHVNNSPAKPVILIFGVLFAVFVIFLLIRLCGYMSHNSSQGTRNNRQNISNPGVITRNNRQNISNPGVIVPRLNRCGHTSCSRNYLLNPAGACRFQNNILPTAPTFDGVDVGRPLTHNTRNPTTQLDLPPTYSSSAHNSTQNLNDSTIGFNKNVLHTSNSENLNLPPSYDEAVHDDARARQNLQGGGRATIKPSL